MPVSTDVDLVLAPAAPRPGRRGRRRLRRRPAARHQLAGAHRARRVRRRRGPRGAARRPAARRRGPLQRAGAVRHRGGRGLPGPARRHGAPRRTPAQGAARRALGDAMPVKAELFSRLTGMVVIDRAELAPRRRPAPTASRSSAAAPAGCSPRSSCSSSSADSGALRHRPRGVRRARPRHRLRHLRPAPPPQRARSAHERVRRRAVRPARLGRRAGRDPDPLGFLPRMEFSAYLQDTLADVADHRLTISAGRVDDIVPVGGGFELRTRDRVADRRHRSCSPTATRRRSRSPSAASTWPGCPATSPNPWDLAAIRALPGDAAVVIVGTGLTADRHRDHPARGRAGPPRRHGQPARPAARAPTSSSSRPPGSATCPTGPLTADGIAAFVRGQVDAARAHGVDWRNVVDGLRPATQSIWLRLDLARAATVPRRRTSATGRSAGTGWRPRSPTGSAATAATAGSTAGRGRRPRPHVVRPSEPSADAVVNCTGPLTDISRTDRPAAAGAPDPRPGGPGPAAARPRLDARR